MSPQHDRQSPEYQALQAKQDRNAMIKSILGFLATIGTVILIVATWDILPFIIQAPIVLFIAVAWPYGLWIAGTQPGPKRYSGSRS